MLGAQVTLVAVSTGRFSLFSGATRLGQWCPAGHINSATLSESAVQVPLPRCTLQMRRCHCILPQRCLSLQSCACSRASRFRMVPVLVSK